MNKVYYDDYSNGCILTPKPHHKTECETKSECECEVNKPPCECSLKKSNSPSLFESFLPNLKLDDIILIAIILIFLNDGCEDKSLLLIIGAIFLLGFN